MTDSIDLQLHAAADDLIRGAVNWLDDDQSMDIELLCDTPLFSHFMKTGYELDQDEQGNVVVSEWSPYISDEGEYNQYAWTSWGLEKWLGEIAAVTDTATSPAVVQQLAMLIKNKMAALGVTNG